MKIITYLLCGIALAGSRCYAEDEIDPFGPQQPTRKPEIPKRGIVTLPSSVTYQLLGVDRHQYKISGLYPPDEDDDPKESESYCTGVFETVFPDQTKVEVAMGNRVLAVTTSQAITNDALAFAVDWVACGGGQVPTWVELEARDLKKSENYDQKHYQVEKLEDEFSVGFAWLCLPRTGELRVPFVTCLMSTGTLQIGPTTGRCPCHTRFAIRILDEKNRLIWEASDPAFGSVRFAVGDRDGDNVHEVYLEVDDHGTKSRLLIKPRIEDSTDQPATDPKSKPEGDEQSHD